MDYQEIIALSESPDETFDEVPGRPPTSEELELVAEVADAVFCQGSLEEKIRITRAWPAPISARRLALLSAEERAKILVQLPTGSDRQ